MGFTQVKVIRAITASEILIEILQKIACFGILL